MHISVVTLFPELITSVASTSILGRGQSAGAFSLTAHQLRDFSTDKHRTVDDAPAGGGAGMVLKVDVVVPAIRHALAQVSSSPARTRVIFMDAGKIVEDCSKDDFFNNPDARTPRAKDFLSKILQH